jgi:hypothetical protein
MGIYWGTSNVLAHKSIVLEAAEDVAIERPATALWVNAHPYQDDVGIGLTTEGLAAFVGRELHFLPHCEHQIDDLFNRALNFAEYLYANGLVVKDGESLGYSETDKFRARWTDEQCEDGKVLKWIEFRVETARH